MEYESQVFANSDGFPKSKFPELWLFFFSTIMAAFFTIFDRQLLFFPLHVCVVVLGFFDEAGVQRFCCGPLSAKKGQIRSDVAPGYIIMLRAATAVVSLDNINDFCSFGSCPWNMCG